MFIVFVVAIGFGLIPASLVNTLVNDRVSGLYHMQMISGMNKLGYWLANLCFDTLKALIPSSVVIGLIYAFDLSYPYVWLIFLLTPLGLIPFTYCSSYLFHNEHLA